MADSPLADLIARVVAPQRPEQGPVPGSSASIGSMLLTPQERFLYGHHMDNMLTGNVVRHPNGAISTVYQMSVEGPGGMTYNIPTVWGGKILPARQAIGRAAAEGWDKWPSYPNEQDAESRYQLMHAFMERDIPQ